MTENPIQAHEIERSYLVTNGHYKIRAKIHFGLEGVRLSVMPLLADKFWFEKSHPEVVLKVAEAIYEIAKDTIRENPEKEKKQ